MNSINPHRLVDEIINRCVNPPTDMNSHEMMGWLNGYATCQNDILDIINSIVSDSEQNN